MLKYTQNMHGSVSILSMIVMLLLLTIGASMLAVSSSDVTATGSYRDGLTAQYAAELGVKHAIYQLKYDATVLANVKNLNNSNKSYIMPNKNSLSSVIPNVSYDVKYIWFNNMPRIEAVGTANSAHRKVVVPITMPSDPSAFAYIVYAGQGNTNVANNAVITGSIRSNGEINVSNNATVNGDAIACGTNGKVNESKKGDITGEQKNYATALEANSLNEYSYVSKGSQLNNSIPGKTILELEAGTYYVDSDFTISNQAVLSANGNVKIYVRNQLHLDNNSQIIGDNIMIICGGDLNIDNNVTINRAIIVANNNINVKNGSNLTGTFISKNGGVNIDQVVTLTYDAQLVGNNGLASTLSFGDFNNH